MKKSLAPKLAALAGVAALSVSSVNAADSGVYTKLDAGVSFVSGMDLRIPALPALGSNSVKFKTGFATNGVVGLNLHEHFALELEGGYATNNVKSVGGDSVSGIDVSTWSGFGNLVLRTNLGEAASIFVGGGPGFVHGRIDGLAAESGGLLSDGTDTIFAGQAKAGLSVKVAEQISVDLTYRARFIGGFDVGPTRASSSVNHQITAGISIGF
jgi:opacity protein-like surface antigen